MNMHTAPHGPSCCQQRARAHQQWGPALLKPGKGELRPPMEPPVLHQGISDVHLSEARNPRFSWVSVPIPEEPQRPCWPVTPALRFRGPWHLLLITQGSCLTFSFCPAALPHCHLQRPALAWCLPDVHPRLPLAPQIRGSTCSGTASPRCPADPPMQHDPSRAVTQQLPRAGSCLCPNTTSPRGLPLSDLAPRQPLVPMPLALPPFRLSSLLGLSHFNPPCLQPPSTLPSVLAGACRWLVGRPCPSLPGTPHPPPPYPRGPAHLWPIPTEADDRRAPRYVYEQACAHARSPTHDADVIFLKPRAAASIECVSEHNFKNGR